MVNLLSSEVFFILWYLWTGVLLCVWVALDDHEWAFDAVHFILDCLLMLLLSLTLEPLLFFTLESPFKELYCYLSIFRILLHGCLTPPESAQTEHQLIALAVKYPHGIWSFLHSQDGSVHKHYFHRPVFICKKVSQAFNLLFFCNLIRWHGK